MSGSSPPHPLGIKSLTLCCFAAHSNSLPIVDAPRPTISLSCTQSKLHLRSHTSLEAHSETHTKRQATQHDCLSSLLGDCDIWVEIVYGEAAKAEHKYLLPALRAKRTNQRRTPFIGTLWIPIQLSSTVSRGHATLSSLSGHTCHLKHPPLFQPAIQTESKMLIIRGLSRTTSPRLLYFPWGWLCVKSGLSKTLDIALAFFSGFLRLFGFASKGVCQGQI